VRRTASAVQQKDISQMLEEDLDSIIENETILIPACFLLKKDNQGTTLGFMRTLNRTKLMKSISIDTSSIDMFQI